MKLLLDTHVAVWSVGPVRRMPADIVDLIHTEAEAVHVSLVSVWEIGIKATQGRRDPINYSVAEALGHFAEAGFQLLPLSIDHMLSFEYLPVLHRDPFDRMLVAQAKVEGFTLLTHDRTLAGYGTAVQSF